MCIQNTNIMGENMENKKSKFRIKEKMLVFVNNDWHRSYVASINRMIKSDGTIIYSAKCKMKDFSIVSAAKNKTQLSMRMDELATVIEEYTSPKLPFGVSLIADIICCVN
jgi:hypothetical protein